MKKVEIRPLKKPDRIISYWLNDKFTTFLIVVFGLAFNILIVFGPIYQGKLIDTIANNEDFTIIIKSSVIYIIVIIFIQTLRYFKRFFIRRFANQTIATMRLMTYNNIMHKSVEEIEKDNVGNLMARIITDVNLCVEGMRKFTTELFDTGILMISYFVTMLYFDVRITMIAIVFIPLAMILAQTLKKLIYKASSAHRKKSSSMTELTYETIDNYILYRISGMEAQNEERYNQELIDLKKKAIKANILENSMQPIYKVIAMLGVIFVLYLGGVKTIEGKWTIGEFSSYLTIFIAVAAKASSAAKLFNSVQKSQVSWERIKPYLTEYEVKNKDININQFDTTLSVNHLSFSYNLPDKPVIENISFTGSNGQIIGVTGAIASGKSSLGVALLGLYPYLGSIKIDNKELSEYSEYERSQMISYLGHRPQLLSDTIYNNIMFGRIGDIDEVLTNICFIEDLKMMKDGQDTIVGNGGVRLSGGQQARIALARALLNKNKIIILDDPFSAVDMKTEEQIIQNLKANYQNSLIILISHRLAIFDKIDKVIFLKSDKSYLYGTHEELMKQNTEYADIYNLQQVVE